MSLCSQQDFFSLLELHICHQLSAPSVCLSKHMHADTHSMHMDVCDSMIHLTGAHTHAYILMYTLIMMYV